MSEATIWGIHAGRSGDAETFFLKKNRIGIGWAKVGDVSALAATRDAFKSAVEKAYSDKKPGAIPNSTGQIYRFVHEMKPGDLVAYPSKLDRRVYVGRVEGPYRYDPQTEPGYPHTRPVKWIKSVARE